MTLRTLPEIKTAVRPSALAFDPPEGAMTRWNGALRAAAGDSGTETTIDVMDVIGEDFWSGGGVTAKSVQAKLKSAGAVVVNVNSPGGDFFEGVAIYNILRAHQGKVTVNIMGLAASAAAILSMAGDIVNIAAAGFLMIHNAWCVAMGDRHDMADASAFLAPFDEAQAQVFAARSGVSHGDIVAMLDNETWLSGTDAVAQKFADALLPADQVKEDAKAKAEGRTVNALRRVDSLLAAHGLPRSDRRGLIKELRTGMPSAAGSQVMPGADLSGVADSLRRLAETINRRSS